MTRGKIYILTNDAMPDYIKIGYTAADDVETRMKQLDTTGLPLPFRLYACVEVEMAQQLERLAHEVFATQRARANREFFLVEPETAVKYLQAVSMNDPKARWISAGQEMIDESGNRLGEEKVVKPRRTNFTFSSADVPIGAEILFARNPSFVANVFSDSEVVFEDQVTKLSPLAKIIFDRLGIGNASGVYAGPDHFTYEDEILSDRRRRVSLSVDEA
jgi:T5orf172 domain